jgi:hypothetical protein
MIGRASAVEAPLDLVIPPAQAALEERMDRQARERARNPQAAPRGEFIRVGMADGGRLSARADPRIRPENDLFASRQSHSSSTEPVLSDAEGAARNDMIGRAFAVEAPLDLVIPPAQAALEERKDRQARERAGSPQGPARGEFIQVGRTDGRRLSGRADLGARPASNLFALLRFFSPRNLSRRKSKERHRGGTSAAGSRARKLRLRPGTSSWTPECRPRSRVVCRLPSNVRRP